MAGEAHNAGKACIIVVNKWDLLEKDNHTMNDFKKEIARELEEHDLTSGAKDIMPYGEAEQLSFFRESDEPTMEHPFMAELREKDLSDMTPLEALNYLYVLQEKLKNEE